MRQTSAESREIDLMMRQWKPEMQRLAPGGIALRVMLIVLFASGTDRATRSAAAEDHGQAVGVQTHTALTIATRQGASQSGGRSGSQLETVMSAHVTDAAGAALREQAGLASVSFDLGSSSLGSAVLDEKGDAVLTVTNLPATDSGAALSVHAVYHPAPSAEGSSTVAGSVSAAKAVEADATGVPNFTLTANPSTLSVTKGQSVTTALTVTPTNGFNEQVTLSCSNPPAQTTCTFSPVIESTANGAFTSTLQIQTEAASGVLNAPEFGVGRGSHIAFAWLLPGVLALAGFAGLRRRALAGGASRRGLAVLLLLAGSFAGAAGLVGCSTRYGYVHHPPLANTGTATGTYTLTIDASGNDGSAVTTQSTNLVLQVK